MSKFLILSTKQPYLPSMVRSLAAQAKCPPDEKKKKDNEKCPCDVKKKDGGGEGEPPVYGAIYEELFKRCPPEQLQKLQILHAKHKQYVNYIENVPNKLPKIDWEFYKNSVPQDKTQMVDEFKAQYEKVQIPKVDYPKDVENELNMESEQVKRSVEEYKKQSNERIKKLEERVAYLKSLLKYEEMTVEEYMIARPEFKKDFINKPTFWPHNEEENTPKKDTKPHH